MSGFQKNSSGEKALRKQAAIALLRIASIFQANEKAEWVKGPPRSKPGEHLRIDTGNARDNLVYTPTSVDEVANTLEVAVGYRKNAWYVPPWEYRSDGERRIGLPDKLSAFMKSGILGGIMSEYTK